MCRFLQRQVPWLRDFYFDIHHFVRRTEREGLTRAQYEDVMAATVDAVDESI